MKAACFVIATAFALDALAQGRLPDLPDHGSPPLLDAIHFSKTGQRLRPSTKIVGGTPATIEENPWQVAIVWAGETDPTRAFLCGGGVYSRRWIVTAAHCVGNGTTADQIQILAGTANWASGTGQRLTVDAGGIVVHPQWDPDPENNKDYDIAVVRVTTDIESPAIDLISRDDELNVLAPGTLVRVTGWGDTEYQGHLSLQLMKIEVPIVAYDVCSDATVYGGLMTQRMVCAGPPEGGKDACQGDSGGPLTATGARRRVLGGVVSWGKGCALPNYPGVYSRVAVLADWVRATAR